MGNPFVVAIQAGVSGSWRLSLAGCRERVGLIRLPEAALSAGADAGHVTALVREVKAGAVQDGVNTLAITTG